MTKKEFLKELKKTKKNLNWNIQEFSKRIRGRGDCVYCPITAVYYNKFNEYCHEHNWYYAASKLGLHHETAERIVNAADTLYFYPKVRRELLETLSLKD